MIELFDSASLFLIIVGVLGILSFALGILAILEVRNLARPRRRRSTWI